MLVLVLVLVVVLVAVGGRVVFVGGSWVGVDDGLGVGSIVALGTVVFSTTAEVVGEPVLHPTKIIIVSKKIKMKFFDSTMIGFISLSPSKEFGEL